MKQYNFDEIIDRRHTQCVKHDGMAPLFGSNDLLPMWVADMDFRSPDFVMEAIKERCQHEVLGYATPSESYYETVISWLQKRYQITATKQELHFIPGIVAGISFVIQQFTKPNDKILVFNPVYPPFIDLPTNNQRPLVCSPLKIVQGRFVIDFEDLAQKAQGCKLMILSNPHNPGGTVWTAEDLRRIAEICHKNGIIVIADEIHADLTLPGHKHTSYSTVSEYAKEHSITFIAPSKTFNIAGLGSSISYTPNEDLRKQLHDYLNHYEVANGNIFAYVGAEATFKYGEDWLNQLLQYLQSNVETLNQYLKQYLPKIKAILPEASFLAWLDFSDYGYPHKETKNKLINEAKVALNDGTTFGGQTYNNCFRINLGCPKATLIKALNQIREAFEN